MNSWFSVSKSGDTETKISKKRPQTKETRKPSKSFEWVTLV